MVLISACINSVVQEYWAIIFYVFNTHAQQSHLSLALMLKQFMAPCYYPECNLSSLSQH